MLSEEQNQALTQVGAGTPMGELLRRYWMPIAAVAELDDQPTKPVRLMGEDLVLYRDKARHTTAWSTATARTAAPISPTAGSRPAACAATTTAGSGTTRASAWQQPFEETAHPEARFKDRMRDQGLPGRGQGGPALGLPGARRRRRWCPPGSPSPGRTASCRSSSPRCRATGSSARRTPSTPCTSSGCTRNWSRALAGADGQRSPTHLKIGFDEFEYGFIYRRVLEGQSEHDELWTVGRTLSLAELPLHRRPLRVARAHRRRQHAERGLVLRPRAERDGALRAGPHPLLV